MFDRIYAEEKFRFHILRKEFNAFDITYITYICVYRV